MSIDEKAREIIEKYGMLTAGDTVYAGVSGGADSVCLLHFLLGIKDEYSLDITALHLNHQLRGEESERDESFVREICERHGIKLIIEREDVAGLAKKRALSLEEAGREARYAFFSRCCSEKPAKIAVAHNLNDSVETLLLNLARGTALRGLCGIPPVRGNIIRPLIECPRAEIEKYCDSNKLSYIIDSSNESDDFARNRLRHHVLPVFESINPNFLNNESAMLHALRADADYLDNEASKSLSDLKSGENAIDRKKYLALPRPLRFRMLLLWLSGMRVAMDNARLSRLDEIAESGSGAEQLAGNLCYKSSGSVIYLEKLRVARRKLAHEYYFAEVNIPKRYETAEIQVFSDKKLCLMNTDYEYYEENIKYDEKLLKNAVDCDKINGIVKLQQKSFASKIKLAGRGVTKTLKKLFQETGVSAEERGRVLMLEDEGGLIWVEGYGASERAAVTDKTREVLILNVKNGG